MNPKPVIPIDDDSLIAETDIALGKLLLRKRDPSGKILVEKRKSDNKTQQPKSD